MDKSESRMMSAAKTMGKAGVAGAALALGAAVKVGFGEFMEAQKITAQTNAVLKSTGGVAKVSTKAIQDLSQSLMRKSGVDDEAIQSGANMLLTFTKIRNEAGAGNKVFDAATKATLNLSVAMGKDMQSSAVLVGKALNDPIKGIGALSRVGVQLEDSQKKLIKSMVASGNTMGAQKVILGELETQFGGSAEAAGKTFAGQLSIAKETLTNLAGEGVGKLMPKLTELGTWLGETAVPKITGVISALTGSESLKVAFSAIKRFIDESFKPAVRGIFDVFSNVLTAVKRVLDSKRDELKTVFDAMASAAKVISTVFTEAIVPALKFIFKEGGIFDKAFGLAIEIIAGTVKAIGGIVDGVKAAVRGVQAFWRGDGGKVFKTVFDAMELAIKPVVTGFQAIVDAVRWLIENISKIPKPSLPNLPDINPFGSETGKVSPVAGVTSKLADEIALGRGMGLTLTSGLRPGDPGDHGRGYAIDMAGPASTMAAFAMAAMGRAGIKDVIFGGLPFWQDNGRRVSTWAGNDALRASHLDHAHVSAFAAGGIVTRPTLALIGEAGPEAVVPLNRRQSVGPTINVTVNGWVGNDQDIAEKIRTIFIKKRRLGVDLGFA